jgi:aromatase
VSTRIDNSILVKAPLDLVWEMTNDVESWPHLFTEYSEVEILGRDGGTTRIRLTTHADDNGKVWTWESERTPDAATHTVTARRVDFSTGPFASMEIRWEYREVPEGVEMRWVQDFELKPGLPFTADQMAGHLSGNTVEQMEAVKAQLELAAERRAADVGV